MKQNISQKVIRFTVKYIWIFCALLILAELGSTVFCATVLMKQTAEGMMQSVGGEISGRVDGVLRLLQSMAKDDRFADTSQPLYDRAQLALPYKENFNLFMVALTDREVNVVSTNTKYAAKPSNLAHRDYMQKMYQTGEYQITNAFPAGTDGTTLNYTIVVPILENGVTVGGLFGSIYFEDIQEILTRNVYGKDRHFYLLGADNAFMAGGDGLYQMEFLEQETHVRTMTAQIDEALRTGTPVGYWQWGARGLCYLTGMRVAPTNWNLLYQVQFSSVLLSFLPILLTKMVFYLLLCAGVSVLGRRYLLVQLDEISHLWDKVTALQREVFQTDKIDYNSVLQFTAQGITDQLTGLFTRTVLFDKMQKLLSVENARCAVFFLDLDDLKRINDNFGHEAGDIALVSFAKILKQYEVDYHGVSARYGGDEFILVLEESDQARVKLIANELCTALRITISVNGVEIPLHGSIGVSLFPQHGDSAEALICKSDAALYHSKANGKNQCTLYDGTAGGIRL